MPDSLHAAAVKLAGAYGLATTARALCRDYSALKERVDGVSSQDVHLQRVAPAFMGLVPPAPAASLECIVELESSRGTKMRIHLKSNPHKSARPQCGGIVDCCVHLCF